MPTYLTVTLLLFWWAWAIKTYFYYTFEFEHAFGYEDYLTVNDAAVGKTVDDAKGAMVAALADRMKRDDHKASWKLALGVIATFAPWIIIQNWDGFIEISERIRIWILSFPVIGIAYLTIVGNRLIKEKKSLIQWVGEYAMAWMMVAFIFILLIARKISIWRLKRKQKAERLENVPDIFKRKP